MRGDTVPITKEQQIKPTKAISDAALVIYILLQKVNVVFNFSTTLH